MADQSGLTLDQVRNQWQESERLLDEVRLRLDSIATARDSADRARAGIEDSRDELRALSANLAEALSGLQQTLQAAGSALESLVKTAETSQPGKLLAAIDDTSVQIQGLKTSNSRIDTAIHDLSTQVSAAMVSMVSLQKASEQRISSAEQDAESARTELAALKAKLAQAIDTIPGRHQARFRAALGDQ